MKIKEIFENDDHELEDDNYDYELDYDDDDDVNAFYVAFYDDDEDKGWIGLVVREGSRWREKKYKGQPDYNWGTGYMGHLSPDDIMSWIHKDYSRKYYIDGPFFDPEEAENWLSREFGVSIKK